MKATTADLVAPVVARAEPRFLELLGAKTSLPVPTVYGYCDDHPELPAPFLLLSLENGTNLEGHSDQLSAVARQTVLQEAGENLAELHDLGPLPAYGTVGVTDDRLTVLDSEDNPQYEDFRDKLLTSVDKTLDSLTQGGFFPELTDDPERFADLVPPLRGYLHETIPELPQPEPPTYNYWDYRYGNLLLDPQTGELQAALDWANIGADDPAYNLTKVESNLLTPERDGETRTATLRHSFRTAYAEARNGWQFDAATRERMEIYRLIDRLDRMACRCGTKMSRRKNATSARPNTGHSSPNMLTTSGASLS